MFEGKYGKLLTVILIIAIIAIILILIIVGIKIYKNYEEEQSKEKVFAELKQNEIQEDQNTNNEEEENLVIGTVEKDNTITEGQTTTSRPKTQYYKDYPMVGYIKIEKTGIEYPILLDISASALETSVGVMYPTNPELNTPGNVVIIGHNYRNNKFFSKNKNLAVGDKIQITDLTGKTLTYTIYEKFETTANDTEYITRDRGDNIEISLSTCTDQGDRRLIILARV